MAISVAVLGGGNGGHAAAADLTRRGFEVHLYEDKKFAANMQQVFDTHEISMAGAAGTGTVTISMVTSDLAQALEGVRYIFVAVPAFAHDAYAEKLAEAVKPGQIITLLPGTFDSLIVWKKLKEKGVSDVVVAETNTLPYATRLRGPGDTLIMSIFDPLKIGVMPACKTQETVEELKQFYPQLEAVESVVACGLSSLNPIIHVPGCVLNAGHIERAKGEFYFYTEGFSSCVARTTEQVDQERIALLKHFGYSSDIVAHGIGGEIVTDDIGEAIAGDPNFAKIKGPGDLQNRYFSEDIPYGIAPWAKLAHAMGIPCPLMDSLIYLGSALLGYDCWGKGHSLEDLGIAGMDTDTLKNYLQNG
ncbi:MAG: NAD/NADP octopine/nopaline dehydrogenase family protein [Massiliimalia sp.]|jgi:opine dehydrogenase